MMMRMKSLWSVQVKKSVMKSELLNNTKQFSSLFLLVKCMKLVKRIEKKSKNLIKKCSDYWTHIDFGDEEARRILSVEIETDFNTKKLTLYYHAESEPLEFSLEYTKLSQDIIKYSTVHVNFLDNITVRIIKDSTYRTDNRITEYHKEWLLKLKIDYTKHIKLLKELAEDELEDCSQVLNVILNFKMFYNLLLQVATQTGQSEKYVKEVYADSTKHILAEAYDD